MKIFQSRSFRKRVKRFTPKEKLSLDDEIKKIIKDPAIGTEKKGDLKCVFVHKFKVNVSVYLLSYRSVAEGIELITIGLHENYYRDLKLYLKKR